MTRCTARSAEEVDRLFALNSLRPTRGSPNRPPRRRQPSRVAGWGGRSKIVVVSAVNIFFRVAFFVSVARHLDCVEQVSLSSQNDTVAQLASRAEKRLPKRIPLDDGGHAQIGLIPLPLGGRLEVRLTRLAYAFNIRKSLIVGPRMRGLARMGFL